MLSTDPADETVQSSNRLYVDYPRMPSIVSPGDTIFVDDGLLSLTVTGVNEAAGTISTVAENAVSLGERKGVNLPGLEVDLPAVSEKDKEDLVLARSLGLDFVYASFVRKVSLAAAAAAAAY